MHSICIRTRVYMYVHPRHPLHHVHFHIPRCCALVFLHLTAFYLNHVRHKLKDELRTPMLSDGVQEKILSDIFGKCVGWTFLTGLVDQPSVEAFEENLDHLAKKWKLHDVDNESGPVSKFSNWFYTHKDRIIKEHMLRPVCKRAGLGCPPEAFFTIASGYINNVIKVK